MTTERVVLVITNDPSVLATLPPTVPFEREVRVANSLEAAVLVYDDVALKLGQIYLDPRTPRSTFRAVPAPSEAVGFIRDYFSSRLYDGDLYLISDTDVDTGEQAVERHQVGDRIRTFFQAPD